MAIEIDLGDERLVALELPAVDDARLSALTPAERDVVRGVLAGESNEELAERRGVSTRTIANQLATIFRKLGVSGRAALVAEVVPRA